MTIGFILWVAFCVLIGVWANSKGRSGIIWSLVAFFISPLLSGIIVLVLPRKN